MRNALTMLAICVLATGTGCHAIDFYPGSLQEPTPPELETPRELSMVSLPAYRIEPPDVVRIRVTKAIPRASYRISPLDVLEIKGAGVLQDMPIDRYYDVESDGTVNLGPAYGIFAVAGLTVEEAAAEITRALRLFMKAPMISVKVSRSAVVAEVSDEYRVQPDGTVNFGQYGMVYLSGKTVTEAMLAVQAHLSQYFDIPQAEVEVVRYNSKSYYVVCEGLVSPDSMSRFSITGNETVLDAISRASIGSKMRHKTIWVARPAPGNSGCSQILPVDWNAVAHGARTDTNYQILPGDRIYIVEDSVVAANRVLGTLTSPITTVLGIASLGASTGQGMEVLGRDFNRQRRY
jgi:polysaccharide biosynthesis/export protein